MYSDLSPPITYTEIVRVCLVFAVKSKQCEDAFKNSIVIESARHYGSTATCDVARSSRRLDTTCYTELPAI